MDVAPGRCPMYHGSQRMYPGCELLSEIADIEMIAVGNGIRDLRRLRRDYGDGRWRKLKGKARVLLPDGTRSMAEVHWYEMSSVGRKELKIKRLVN